MLIIPVWTGQELAGRRGQGQWYLKGLLTPPFCGLLRGLIRKVFWGDSFPKLFAQRGHLPRACAPLRVAYGARSQACQPPGHWPLALDTQCVAYHLIPVYVPTRLFAFCISPCCSQKAEQTAWRSSETGLIKPDAHWLFELFNQLFL